MKSGRWNALVLLTALSAGIAQTSYGQSALATSNQNWAAVAAQLASPDSAATPEGQPATADGPNTPACKAEAAVIAMYKDALSRDAKYADDQKAAIGAYKVLGGSNPSTCNGTDVLNCDSVVQDAFQKSVISREYLAKLQADDSDSTSTADTGAKLKWQNWKDSGLSASKQALLQSPCTALTTQVMANASAGAPGIPIAQLPKLPKTDDSTGSGNGSGSGASGGSNMINHSGGASTPIDSGSTSSGGTTNSAPGNGGNRGGNDTSSAGALSP